MIVLLIILSVGLLGLIIYYAVSPKSSRILKLAATIALGVICLSILICAIFIIIGPKNDPNAVLLPFMSEEGTQPARRERAGSMMDIIILMLLLGGIGLVIAKSMKEQKKMAKLQVQSKPKKTPIIQEDKEIEEESTSFLDDESFNLGLDD